MKKKLVILLLVILSAGTWIYFKYRSPSQESAPEAVWVQTGVVKTSTLPLEAKAIGTLVARSVDITPEFAGHVRSIYFRDGESVTKDSPLIQLDDSVYKAKYESTKAQLAFSQNDYNRKNLLVKQGAVTRAAIDQAEADLKEKTANTQENAVMVSKMRLTAPFDGVVGKSKVNPGDYVTTGQSIVTLTDTRHLRIEYSVPEKFLPLLKTGQKVKLTTSTYPGKEFSGTVSFISPTVDTENRSVFLYADVPNESSELAPGMFVNVTQFLGAQENVLMIPARSLVPILDGEQVYKVVNGKAFAVTVIIGRRLDDNVQVVQGLSPGDVVITDGQIKIKNGMPVQTKS